MTAPLTVAMHAVYHFTLPADLTRVETCASMLSGTANTLTRPKAMQEIAPLSPNVGHIIPVEAYDGLPPTCKTPKEVT